MPTTTLWHPVVFEKLFGFENRLAKRDRSSPPWFRRLAFESQPHEQGKNEASVSFHFNSFFTLYVIESKKSLPDFQINAGKGVASGPCSRIKAGNLPKQVRVLDAGSNGAYRRRMKPLFVLLSLCFPCSLFFSQAANALFAFADDWGRQASIYAKIEGAGGINDAAKTPHFDKLAKSGVLFTNASVNAPSCTPCRTPSFRGETFGKREGSHSSRGGLGREDPDLAFVAQGFGIPYWLYLQSLVARHSSGCRDWRTGQCLCQGRREIQRLSQYVSGGLQRDCRRMRRRTLSGSTGNFKSFLEDRKKDQPFVYWFGPTNAHRKWTKGSGKILGDRSRRAQGQDACILA